MITGLPAAQSGVFAAHGPQTRFGHAGQSMSASLADRLAVDGAGGAEDRQLSESAEAARGYAPAPGAPPPPSAAGSAAAQAAIEAELDAGEAEARAPAREEAGPPPDDARDALAAQQRAIGAADPSGLSRTVYDDIRNVLNVGA